MKLELNLPALERLIGDDKEMEVCLKKQIVHEFSKRHLKEIAETNTYSAVQKEIKVYVDNLVREHFGVETNSKSVIDSLRYQIEIMISDLVRNHAQKAVDEAVERIIKNQRMYWGREINRAVEKALNKQIEKEIQEGIRKRLDLAKTISEVQANTEESQV